MAVHIVHVLADRVAQSLLFKSSVFRPQVDLKVRPMDGYHETLIILIKTMTLGAVIFRDRGKLAEFAELPT